MRMEGRKGLITAAGSGMGRAGAVRMAREGATIAVVDIDREAAEATVNLVHDLGGRALALAGDLRSDDFAAHIVHAAADAFGGLDFVWNHVGVPGPAAFDDLDLADYELAFDINLRSPVVTTREALPLLRESGRGAVLFTSSSSGVVGSPLSPTYSATKFGQIGLMRSLAKRYGRDKIRFNCIAPGAVDTPMLRDLFSRPDSPAPRADVEQRIADRVSVYPLGRIAQPEDIANAALFLLSDEAAFISGSVLLIDGAMTA